MSNVQQIFHKVGPVYNHSASMSNSQEVFVEDVCKSESIDVHLDASKQFLLHQNWQLPQFNIFVQKNGSEKEKIKIESLEAI